MSHGKPPAVCATQCIVSVLLSPICLSLERHPYNIQVPSRMHLYLLVDFVYSLSVIVCSCASASLVYLP